MMEYPTYGHLCFLDIRLFDVKHSDLFVKDMSVSDMQTVFSSFQCDMEDTAPFP